MAEELRYVSEGWALPADCTCNALTASTLPEGGYTYRVHTAACDLTQRAIGDIEADAAWQAAHAIAEGPPEL